MSKIVIDEDQYYAPCCYLICKVDKNGDWSTRDEENTVLVQTDYDYLSIASLFGFEQTGELTDIDKAQEIIDEHLGEMVDDPGYFD